MTVTIAMNNDNNDKCLYYQFINVAFHAVDDSLSLGSISLGVGEFPSMNSLEQSISLPQFPLESRAHRGDNSREHSTMDFISEEVRPILALLPALLTRV